MRGWTENQEEEERERERERETERERKNERKRRQRRENLLIWVQSEVIAAVAVSFVSCDILDFV
jgi:hypothetical protein